MVMKPILKNLEPTEMTYTLPSDAGDLAIKVYSNQNYNIALEDNTGEWVTVAERNLTGDGTLHVEYDFNDGFPRMAKILPECQRRQPLRHDLPETERCETRHLNWLSLI